MSNHTTGTQRYNKRMDKIFETYQKQQEEGRKAHPYCMCDHGVCHKDNVCPSEIPF